jgi:hypothetical protein
MRSRLYRSAIVIALAAAFFQSGNGRTGSPAARAQDGSRKEALFTASHIFGLAQGQRARFCVGTLVPRGPALDWSVRISDERGSLLLQTPETHSPAGEWRCVDAPRASLAVPGEAGTGRVQVAARQLVKTPLGTKPSEINGSFEIVNEDGTSAGAVAGVLYASLHN